MRWPRRSRSTTRPSPPSRADGGGCGGCLRVGGALRGGCWLAGRGGCEWLAPLVGGSRLPGWVPRPCSRGGSPLPRWRELCPAPAGETLWWRGLWRMWRGIVRVGGSLGSRQLVTTPATSRTSRRARARTLLARRCRGLAPNCRAEVAPARYELAPAGGSSPLPSWRELWPVVAGETLWWRGLWRMWRGIVRVGGSLGSRQLVTTPAASAHVPPTPLPVPPPAHSRHHPTPATSH
ncbi:MAG: hypothetical protein JWQ12_325 [Glaciihabitans sp.]|nr:hypothetical protein [Glaciihabitans sp.]